jgi:RNA polymerase sigma factor (TIGR02999 family)
MPTSPHDVTQLLQRWSNGDREALDKLIPLVYDELRQQAARYMRRERQDHTLQTTALIHEVYLRLVDQTHAGWQNRTQFFGITAQLMRRVLVDHARMHKASKRGGANIKLPLDEELAPASTEPDLNILAIDEALTKLETLDPLQARIVESRFFSGLDVEETARLLEISPRTVKREWSIAKAWIYREITRKRQSHDS